MAQQKFLMDRGQAGGKIEFLFGGQSFFNTVLVLGAFPQLRLGQSVSSSVYKVLLPHRPNIVHKLAKTVQPEVMICEITSVILIVQ